jgi:membrane protein DedA with SNARE-associated domain
MQHRATFWIAVGLATAILVAVVGTIVFALLDEDGAFGLVTDEPTGTAAYFAVFGLVFADAIVPIFPGETTLTTASVLAAQGHLDLGFVMFAGALGAILGDSTLYWIARTGPRKLKLRLNAKAEGDERVANALAFLGRSGPLLIMFGRFLPGVRFAVNASMGLIEYPYRRFLLFGTLGGVLWAVCNCLLAYWVSSALAGYPLASIILSGLLTTALVAGVYWLDRRKARGSAAAVTPRAAE